MKRLKKLLIAINLLFITGCSIDNKISEKTQNYTVTLNTDGGKLEKTIVEVLYNNKYCEADFGLPIKTGYRFIGWYLNTNDRWAENNEYRIYSYTEDITLTAKYDILYYI